MGHLERWLTEYAEVAIIYYTAMVGHVDPHFTTTVFRKDRSVTSKLLLVQCSTSLADPRTRSRLLGAFDMNRLSHPTTAPCAAAPLTDRPKIYRKEPYRLRLSSRTAGQHNGEPEVGGLNRT
jgi:hypothetical protein